MDPNNQINQTALVAVASNVTAAILTPSAEENSGSAKVVVLLVIFGLASLACLYQCCRQLSCYSRLFGMSHDDMLRADLISGEEHPNRIAARLNRSDDGREFV